MEERFKTFTLLMNGINRSIHKLKTAEMAEYQLKSSHVSCLYYLYKEEMTAKDLCDICNEDKANISRAVKYLEENGFLESKAKTQKKYLTPIRLTEKGKEVASRLVTKIDNILDAAGNGVSDENRRIMYESLATIAKNLNELCEKN
ncbi:MAG: winged helix DNA-binding protein [Clostridia bacterium]|nr:winged helix DNA-binding protein [Clostridia bacterium]